MLRKARFCIKSAHRIEKRLLINYLSSKQQKIEDHGSEAEHQEALEMSSQKQMEDAVKSRNNMSLNETASGTNENGKNKMEANETFDLASPTSVAKKGNKQQPRKKNKVKYKKFSPHGTPEVPEMHSKGGNQQLASSYKVGNAENKGASNGQSTAKGNKAMEFAASPPKVYRETITNPVTFDRAPISNAMRQTQGRTHSRGYHNESTPNKDGFPKMNCPDYWELARVEEGIKTGAIMTGSFRINQRNFTNAYITATDGQSDILIEGSDNRNRALQGDYVAVELIKDDDAVKKEVADISKDLAAQLGNLRMTEEKLKQRASQTRGRVVRILEEKHCRRAAGTLKPYRNNQYGVALMSPQDSRLPRIMIPLDSCPDGFLLQPQGFRNILFTAEITGWKQTCGMAFGKLIKQLGNWGEIEPETEGFLAEYGIDDGPFPDEAVACLPTDLPWKVPKAEYAKRRDLRSECIFTIDPSTARDLDDALSVKLKEDGNFKVGVHIADVSYFIEEGSPLDAVASRRATSVYLVQKVVPMLPRLLCEHLCSLNPGDDKLTYSVVWTIAPDGSVLEEWFGRTVIRSCTKLSYDHAQQMIEADVPNTLERVQFPEIHGSHSLVDIHASVNSLYSLSLALRKKRFESGALNLNQPKLSFTLDKETGQPNGFGSFIARESNRLVEEFMLLANMAVAHRLVRSLPDHAFLRRHPTPHPKMMEDLVALCKRSGVRIDAASTQKLHNSIERLKNFDKAEKEALYYAVVSLCSKPMQLAKYFCAGAIEDERLYHHFALNVPLYTHFTSPIRRYPDVTVHRMLTVALGNETKAKSSVEEVQKLAEYCNDRKASAKKVQELSSELFFSCYIQQVGELHEEAVIIGMLDSALDVLLLHCGLVKRVYCNSLPLHSWKAEKEEVDSMTLYWKDEKENTGSEVTSVSNVRSENEAGRRPTVVCNDESKLEAASEKGRNANGLKQVLHIFDRIVVTLKSEVEKGPLKLKVYIPKPE